VAATATNAEIQAAALNEEHTKHFIGEQPIKKVIVVPNKLVNIVI